MFQRAIKNVESLYNKKIKSESGLQRHNLIDEKQFELGILYAEWREVRSRKLLNKAVKYYLSLPEKPKVQESNDDWDWTAFGFILTPTGWEKIEKKLHEKYSRRREILGFYFGVVMGVLSLVVTVVMHVW